MDVWWEVEGSLDEDLGSEGEGCGGRGRTRSPLRQTSGCSTTRPPSTMCCVP